MSTNSTATFSDRPKALEPLYGSKDPGAEILLSTEPFNFWTKEKETLAEGRLYLELNPKPRLELKSDLIANDWGLFKAFLDNDIKIYLNKYPQIEWMLISTKPFQAIAPPNYVSTGSDVRVRDIIFHILNFEKFIGLPVWTNAYTQRLDRIVLRADGWLITLDSMPETGNIVKKLEKDSGYAITHVGKLERETGKFFKVSKGKNF